MASNEIQRPPPSDVGPNQQTQPQQSQSGPSAIPFNKPPQGGSQQPYSLQQGPCPPYQQAQQQGSPYSQQNIYTQPGPYPPPQQGYPQQSYPQPQQSHFSDPNPQVVGEAASFYNSAPPPVVQPGPPGGPSDRGFFDNAMQMAIAQQPQPGPDSLERGWFTSSKNPLDPPPKMFMRPAPGHYAYIKFQPMSVLAVSDKLQDGFALMPPVTVPGDPHPFVSHDITEEDWHKFLKDFQKTAHLSASDRLFQGMANSFMKDKIPSAKIQKRMAENKLEPVNDFLMAWNHYFFHPRRISIVLAKGNRRFSGETDDYPPDIHRHTKKKSHSASHSVDTPLVTVAEPYPKGSLLAPLLNPIHKALYDSTVAVARAPGDLLYGVTPGEKVDLSKSDSDSESDSDTEESIDSEDERKAIHKLGVTDPVSVHAMLQAKRTERKALKDARRAGRKPRRNARKERERYVQAVYYGNYDTTGKEKNKRNIEHEREGGPPSRMFRLVIWDGNREVF